jgi:hypothetical protein
MVAVVGLISIIAPWTCQWPTKMGSAVAVLWGEVVSWTVDVLTGPGVFVLVEQPAEETTRPTTTATNPSPNLTAG